MLTCVVVNPLEVVKTRLQLDSTEAGWTRIVRMVQREGSRSLLSGLGVSLVMQVPATAVYLTLYERLRERMEDNGVPRVLSVMVAGACGRTVAVVASSPLEYVRTVLQAQRAADAWELVRRGLQERGWRSLFVGLVPTLVRDVPFSIIYWSGYVQGKALIAKLVPLDHYHDLSRVVDVSDAVHNFSAGAGSAMVAATITTPFDVVKTRRQVVAHSPHQKPPSLVALLRRIYAVEGWVGFFRGVVPRAAKVVPSCAIMITSYELFKHAFLTSAVS